MSLPAYSVVDPQRTGNVHYASNPGNTYMANPPLQQGMASYPNQYQPMAPVQPVQQCSNNITVVTQQPALLPVVAVRRNLMPDDYLVLSLLTCLFCNWIFGLIALIYSFQVSSAWAAGNHDDARNYSRKARMWSVVSIVSHVVTGCVLGVAMFIYVLV